MKRLLLIPLVLAAGCSTEKVTEIKPVENAPQLGEAIACLQVGPANEDPLINNLIVIGHDVDYNGSTNNWTIDGQVVGSSISEDEGFALCAERSLYDEIAAERDFIEAARGN